jgi:glycosyltransferase involved in cell wall biosynthesis
VSPSIEILLATWNGAAFLVPQLDSILGQTLTDWRLAVRDDGSTDGTRDILARYARADGRITVIDDGRGRLGAALGFGALLDQATADVVLFCDQDDVWTRDKLELSCAALRNLESRAGRSTPALVHTDLLVVDRELRPQAASLWRRQGLDPAHARRLPRLLVRNVVTGCTLAANRALYELARPVPADAYLHDWWLALTAAAFGDVAHLEQTTVRYRQHGANVVGAASPWSALRGALREPARVHTYYARTFAQAAAFLQRFEARLSEPQREMVAAYAELAARGFPARQVALLRHGFRDSGWLRNLAFWAVG